MLLKNMYVYVYICIFLTDFRESYDCREKLMIDEHDYQISANYFEIIKILH